MSEDDQRVYLSFYLPETQPYNEKGCMKVMELGHHILKLCAMGTSADIQHQCIEENKCIHVS